MTRAYYNEHDPRAAAWLRVLADHWEIMPGEVDDRDIQQVSPADFTGAARCHFFAGIGGWDYALRLAGWPTDKPIWTASLPCQPFSQAGQQRGHEDERHLWPVFHDLVEQCRPSIIVGEQVASPLGRDWLAAVQDDLEALGYSTTAADLCAASVGAPHIRQRLFWCAVRGPGGTGACDGLDNAESDRWESRTELHAEHHGEITNSRRNASSGLVLPDSPGRKPGRSAAETAGHRSAVEPASRAGSGLANSASRDSSAEGLQRSGEHRLQQTYGSDGRRLGNPSSQGLQGRLDPEDRAPEGQPVGGAGADGAGERVSDTESLLRRGDLSQRPPEERTADRRDRPWDGVIYIPCADGKARPLPVGAGDEQMADGVSVRLGLGGEAGISVMSPVISGLPNRTALLRGYGNAIVPQVAAVFLSSLLEILHENDHSV